MFLSPPLPVGRMNEWAGYPTNGIPAGLFLQSLARRGVIASSTKGGTAEVLRTYLQTNLQFYRFDGQAWPSRGRPRYFPTRPMTAGELSMAGWKVGRGGTLYIVSGVSSRL